MQRFAPLYEVVGSPKRVGGGGGGGSEPDPQDPHPLNPLLAALLSIGPHLTQSSGACPGLTSNSVKGLDRQQLSAE